jgi:hypothetical protein
VSIIAMQSLEAALLRRLGAVLQINGGMLKTLDVHSFDTPEEFADLLTRFKDSMPAAWLSTPTWQDPTVHPAGRVRRPQDSTYTYKVAGVFTERSSQGTRRQLAYMLLHQYRQLLSDYIFPVSDCPEGYAFDAIEMGGGSMKETAQISGCIMEFSVRVRGPLEEV